MKNKTAEEFAVKFHDNVICVHGAPSHVHSDRGSEFIADIFSELCEVQGIKQTLNSADHPTSTGLAEAGVKRVVSLLRPMIDGHENHWDIKLPQVMWALNTSPSNATSLSPYLLLYGRLPTYPLAYLSKNNDANAPVTRSAIVQDILQTHNELQKYLEKHNHEHDSKMKAYYDRHRKTPRLKIGNIVFVKETIPQSKFKKFAENFVGPYLITFY